MTRGDLPTAVYDLSVPVTDGVDWYREAGCPPVEISDVGSLAEEGWISHTARLMVLNGTTYLQTAAHIYDDAPTLDRMPPERFITRAFVVRIGSERRELPAPDRPLPHFEQDRDAILLSCGWESRVYAPQYYYDRPYFSAELQEWLLEHRPSILGGDMLSFDHPEDTSMPFIRAFFRTGGMILCPLMNLGELPEIVTLCALPTKLAGCNAAPCRALAWREDR